jgi:ectoine hydroxylase-related dioxygenase (phytanoyl-CoA dioxygenase family)
MRLSNAELNEQSLLPETLQHAVQQVQSKGYVLFEAVLPTHFVATLNDRVSSLLVEQARKQSPNRGANRYQMHLPFQAPFNDPDIYCSPFILPIVEALMGKDCVCHYFASDTALPGSEYQAVHWDVQTLFPEIGINHLPPYSLVLNIPLVDFRTDNGPLEIWPDGTHMLHGYSAIEDVADSMHSEAVLMPAGSLLLRDSRMWHRGTPNRSQNGRPNMALIYSRPWLKLKYPPIDISKETYAALSPKAQHLFRMENIHQ